MAPPGPGMFLCLVCVSFSWPDMQQWPEDIKSLSRYASNPDSLLIMNTYPGKQANTFSWSPRLVLFKIKAAKIIFFSSSVFLQQQPSYSGFFFLPFVASVTYSVNFYSSQIKAIKMLIITSRKGTKELE